MKCSDSIWRSAPCQHEHLLDHSNQAKFAPLTLQVDTSRSARLLLEHLGQLLIDLHHLLVIPHLRVRILIIILIPFSILVHSHASRLERVHHPLTERGIDRRHIIILVVVSFNVLLRLCFVLVLIFLHVFVFVLLIVVGFLLVVVIMLVLGFVVLALSSSSSSRRRLELLRYASASIPNLRGRRSLTATRC